MERIKIELPEHFTFSTTIPVRITDINYGDHMGNDTFLSFIHEARVQFLQQYGYTELQIEGIGLIMADVAIEYKMEVLYGDTVRIDVCATAFDRVGFDIFYRLTVEKQGKEHLVCRAKTGMICYDYDLKKKVTVPEAVVRRLSGNA